MRKAKSPEPTRDYREEATVAFIRDPGRWPMWPTLPLRNKSRKGEYGMPLLGFLLDGSGLKVYVGMAPYLTHQDIETYPTEQYETEQAFLLAGWQVD